MNTTEKKNLPTKEDEILLSLRGQIHEELVDDFIRFIDVCKRKMRAEELSLRLDDLHRSKTKGLKHLEG
jgi:hypothetical protein